MKKMCYYCMKPKARDICETCRRKDPIISSEKLLPETILNNKYVVGNPVGSGGFGITYVGLDVSLQLKVAIKEFFPKEFVERNNSISSFVKCTQTDIREKDIANEIIFKTEKDKVINEARTLAKFSKERSIVSVRDYFEANNTAYIVMEYIEGDTLESYILHNGTISADKAFDMLLPIMNVLAKLHNQNIIHRDVSPDNIMFDGSNLKLLDFGAAREVLNNSSKSVSVMVKHGFAPEEQYRKKGRIGAWTDIYSLCATIYFCITGQIPENALDRKEADELKYPSSLGAVINKQQERALMYGLNVSSKDRCVSIEELINVWNGAEIQKNTTDMETERYQETVDIYSFSKNTVDARRINRDTIISSQAETVSPMQQVITRPENNQKKRIPIFLVAIVCALIIAAAAGIIILTNNNSKSHESNNSSDLVSSDINYPDIDNSQVSVNIIEESVNSTDNESSDEQLVSSESSPVSSDSSELSEKESSIIEETSSPELSEEELSIIEETSVLSEEEIRNGKIQEYIEKADNYSDQGKYDEAIAALDTAEQLYGSDPTITSKKMEINKKKSVSTINEYKLSDDYKGAIQYINTLSSKLSSDDEIIEQKNICITKYRNIVLSESEEKFKTSGYSDAIDCLNESLKVIPDDSIINDKISYYQQYAPISIATLEYFTGSDFGVDHNIKDNMGNVHNNVTYPVCEGWSNACNTNVYKINKQYSKLTGLWFQYYNYRTSGGYGHSYKGTLEIYGDGVLLFAGNIGPGIEPISININISSVNELTIDYFGGGSKGTYSGIADFTVQK